MASYGPAQQLRSGRLFLEQQVQQAMQLAFDIAATHHTDLRLLRKVEALCL
jgi:hypothetical protein